MLKTEIGTKTTAILSLKKQQQVGCGHGFTGLSKPNTRQGSNETESHWQAIVTSEQTDIVAVTVVQTMIGSRNMHSSSGNSKGHKFTVADAQRQQELAKIKKQQAQQ